jgi:hypothetical protein
MPLLHEIDEPLDRSSGSSRLGRLRTDDLTADEQQSAAM